MMVWNRYLVHILIVLLVISNVFNASLAFNLRKLIDSEANIVSPNSQLPPVPSPVEQKPINETKSDEGKIEESQMAGQNDSNNKTMVIDPKSAKKNDKANKTSGAPAPIGNMMNGDKVDVGSEKGSDSNVPKLDDNGICNGSLTSCRDKDMIACIKPKSDGSDGLFLVVINTGESTLKVDVTSPDSFGNVLPTFEVLKHETMKVYISSTMGKSKEIEVNSGDAKCVVPLVNRVSVDYFMQQVSFYSRQVTPTYAAYGFFVFTLLFGGTWACCQVRKKRPENNGIAYQELEMGLPESSPVVNGDTTEEGWDNEWDDDDWDDEGDIVKSPGGQPQLNRNISADGLTSRATSKKDGWENDWDD